MTVENIFREKKQFNLEAAEPLKNYLNREFQLESFEVFYSRKWKANFSVIETQNGHLVQSWSKVIAQKLELLKDYSPEEYKLLRLKAIEKKAESGYNYVDLELIE
ncbi:MAG: hypothetical protein ACOC56_01970 [Atribacterota bacterium]